MTARTADISRGGLSLIVPVNISAGAKCLMRVGIPKKGCGASQSYDLQVKVLHSVFSRQEDGFVLGLQFLELPAAANEAITQFLENAAFR
jgi:c-di-GMP-binding flagellar brake protein YcgR